MTAEVPEALFDAEKLDASTGMRLIQTGVIGIFVSIVASLSGLLNTYSFVQLLSYGSLLFLTVSLLVEFAGLLVLKRTRS